MTFDDLFDIDDIEDNNDVRPGPWWRHTLWTVGVTAFGVGLGWAGASSSIGESEFGLPAVAPGPFGEYLVAWAVIGLLTAGVLRATAARVLVHIPGQLAAVLLLVGTRLSLGWRPEAPMLAAMGAACVAVAAIWSAFALRGAVKAARQRAERQRVRDEDAARTAAADGGAAAVRDEDAVGRP
ncbi:hypothetical protein [Streptomyces niveus]|uniref:hypothetical protein n=1 Tax=Streptomyces niveus TaxID=193462 RepID=UPI0034300D22